MNKTCLIFSFLLFFSCNEHHSNVDSDAVTVQKMKPADKQALMISFKHIMDDYYQLKTGFVQESDSLISQSARKMMKAADSLDISQVKEDSLFTEKIHTQMGILIGELEGLLGENGLINKRKSFYLLSEELLDAIKLIHYNNELIYRLNCEDAFDHTGATWLSPSSQSDNPYFPGMNERKVAITDVVDFRTDQSN